MSASQEEIDQLQLMLNKLMHKYALAAARENVIKQLLLLILDAITNTLSSPWSPSDKGILLNIQQTIQKYTTTEAYPKAALTDILNCIESWGCPSDNLRGELNQFSQMVRKQIADYPDPRID